MQVGVCCLLLKRSISIRFLRIQFWLEARLVLLSRLVRISSCNMQNVIAHLIYQKYYCC